MKFLFNSFYQTALCIAIQKKKADIVKLLLTNKARYSNHKIIFFFENFHLIPNFNFHEEALIKAIKYESSEIVKILLTNEEIDINHISRDLIQI